MNLFDKIIATYIAVVMLTLFMGITTTEYKKLNRCLSYAFSFEMAVTFIAVIVYIWTK